MAFSRQEDFPESTLNDDDDRTWNIVSDRSKSKKKGNQSSENPLWRMSREEAEQGQDGNGEQGFTTPQLRPTWARQRVDIDQSSLTSIGKANSTANVNNRWNQGMSGGRGSTGKVAGRAPQRQETPFIQGVNVLQRKQTSREEEETTGYQSKRAEIIEPPFDPTKEPKEAHPFQLRPTPTMYKFSQALFKRNVKEWKLSEILTPGSSDGRSILISAFVDFVSTTLKPDIRPGQLLSVAQIAVVTAPTHILEYLQDTAEARGYLNWVLSFRVKIPPVLEHLLCPLDTPNLIEKQSLRASIRNGDMEVVDQKHVIEVFVKCYYPKSVAAVMEAIDPLDQSVLRDYIEKPGLLLRDMKTRRKAMQFAPPKWYRLSIHPNAKIQPTPRQQLKQTEEKGPQVSIADIELKTRMTAKELTSLPLPKMRTAILTAIPHIFDDRLTREGCSQAFGFFESATQEEMLDFFRMSDEQEEEGMTQLKEATLYRHLLRFEHSERKKNGEWKLPAQEILRRWIDAIHPVLVANNYSLLLSVQPFARTRLDRLILMTPYKLDAQEMHRHIVTKKKSTNPTRFEVWVKSSCSDLKKMTDLTMSGSGAEEYSRRLKAECISVIGLYSSIDEQIPIVYIVGSISTADDRQIAEEMVDRLVVSGLAIEDIPHFHISSTIVSTSTGRIANRTKCVIAAKSDASRFRDMISSLHTPAARDYLVTRDYHFTQIAYPPTDRSDSELASAMDRQQEFTASIVRTSISGFTGLEPFYDTPEKTKDLCTREITSNTNAVAHHLLTSRMLDEDNHMIDNPVIRVSMNKWNDKIYLTALKKDAAELIRFTSEVMKLMDIWYHGHKFTLLSEVVEAQRIVDSARPLNLLQQQALTKVSINPGEISEAQRELDASQTTKELAQTAAAGITNTFVPGDDIDLGTQQAIEDKTGQPATRHGSDINAVDTGSIRREILELKGIQINQGSKLDEIAAIVRKVLMETEDRSKGSTTMMSTITTMLETNKSSVSSVSEVAASCRGYFDEHSTKLHDIVETNSKEILKACRDRPPEDNNMEMIQQLVARQEQAAEKTAAAERAMAEKYDRIVSLLSEQKEYMQQWMNQAPSEPSIDFGGTEDEPRLELTEEDITQSTLEKYNSDVRQHARDLLAFHETMPYAKKALEKDEKVGTQSDGGSNTTESQIAPKDLCKRCNKKDLMLIYCDKCPDPVDLYHPGCLEHVKDQQIRICQECVSGVTNTEDNTLPTRENDLATTDITKPTMRRPEESKGIEEVASRHSDFMSISSSSSHSSSSSSTSSSTTSHAQVYVNTPRTRTLPHLKQTNTQQIITTETKISPLQTRGQRAKKAKQREDAFDSSDDEEEIDK